MRAEKIRRVFQFLGTEMHYINCNLCGADNVNIVSSRYSSLYGKLMRYNFLKCRNCGLTYMNPQPEDEEVRAAYEFLYDKLTPSDETQQQRRSERRWEEYEKLKLIQRYCNRGRILDIGSGFAVFLEVARERGWSVWGLEINRRYADYARIQLNLNVLRLTLREARFSAEFFDVINMDNVLEHLTNPRRELLEVWRVLKRGGYLLIRVPNVDSLLSEFTPLYRLAKGRLRGRYDTPVFHLYFFNLKTLTKMLELCGFTVILATTRFWSYVPTSYYGLRGAATKVFNELGNMLNQGRICTILAKKQQQQGDKA